MMSSNMRSRTSREHYNLNNPRFLAAIGKGRLLSDEQLRMLVEARLPLTERSPKLLELVRTNRTDASGLAVFFGLLRDYAHSLLVGGAEASDGAVTSALFDFLLCRLAGAGAWQWDCLRVSGGRVAANGLDAKKALPRKVLELSLWARELQLVLGEEMKNRELEELLDIPSVAQPDDKDGSVDYIDRTLQKVREYSNKKKSRHQFPSVNSSNVFGRAAPKEQTLFLCEEIEDRERDLANEVNKHNPWRCEWFGNMGTDVAKSLDAGESLKSWQTSGLLDQDERFSELEVTRALQRNRGKPKLALEALRKEREAQTERLRRAFPRRVEEGLRLLVSSDGDLKGVLLSLSRQAFQRECFQTDPADGLRSLLLSNKTSSQRRVRSLFAERLADLQDGKARAALLVDLFEQRQDPKRREARAAWWEGFDSIPVDELVQFARTMRDPADRVAVFESPELNTECMVCMEALPKRETFAFVCGCLYCNACLMGQLQHNLDKSERLLRCPGHQDDPRAEEFETQVYAHLQIIARRNESYHRIFEKFENVYNMNAMHGMPDFTHCAHPPCGGGFVRERGAGRRMVCNMCGKKTCHVCKLPWLREHRNNSCDAFKKWLAKNRPDLYIPDELQGSTYIVCPNCNTKYELARGGCLHFVCPKPTCGFEFCGFCQQPFHKANKNPCTMCEATKGMHAHHPRNCPYYLRDRDVDWMWTLLEKAEAKMEEVLPFNEDKSGTCHLEIVDEHKGILHCDKEPDEKCQGYCSSHFRELASGAIFKRKSIDPVILFTKEELKVLADRENLEVEEKATEEDMREIIMRDRPLVENE